MLQQVVRTRIAPSPTGEDLHIGSVYMALFNWVFAKKHRGKFIVRIEDTDRERFVPGAQERMLASLTWVGIPHDEGVDVGGICGPYRQSERLSIYQKHVNTLINQGDAYYCFCSASRLAEMRQTQIKSGKAPMYDGLCKQIALVSAKERIQTEKYVVRLNVPDSGITNFSDLVHGQIEFQNALIDDQVLIKSDGFPTYHLAVVIDDHLMQISHIIRGEEWISSTPKHILLYQMFGWDLPQFAHLPLLRNPDKSKLSKRKNPVWLSWFRKHGFLPEAILNYLGTITWSPSDGRDLFDVKYLVKNFDLSHIKTTAPIFDLEKLTWLNGEYIRKLTAAQLVKSLAEFTPKEAKADLVKQLVPLARERMKTLNDFGTYVKPFIHFARPTLTATQTAWVSKFNDVFISIDTWETLVLEKIAKKLVNSESGSVREAFMALRLAVSGEPIGLPLFETLEILGKDEVLKRIKQAIT
ncbi:MAG: Glutamyl-tRNA synthetase [Candidatus Gottesmanbacteria bacterium GW2011_GWB1_43_11]|uniref:Glutamate--tRNA ligase n=1 Tax=Candidatus Gottesmanbacteria bacterium GW2011_GWB1_43_11 TaxID=1618446 RepID=A0A0G1CMK0_9BACT|nr:MAG: Glutamyl-tRNA synthetase [Candidatus Gottesmanbacteria bacterium GW2011_GWA2_42_16]KKS55902.1 MAG: Glutamyl-tRNA synthetase [Candidatus Gottesmanbacteria bacterium GW2011_GWA1_42_26]KKS86990.1 MAG: Glutamyl-tRNA synthetase [Candidatus Gottesmanbacteria bacterium GW2011_GWB1_43_11]OGG07818.1 MAG: glutamate--tRNA ligase [Candidatus Gottesmanbacteria bacterium RIFCSPHIGHO2_01_FULL_43_15]HCM38127.1 glutamate--tRNA ligase [Patescibacteria group bacterium]